MDIGEYVCENPFSWLLVNLCENIQEYRRIFGICLFSAILWELTYVQIRLTTKTFHISTTPTYNNYLAFNTSEPQR